MINMQSKYCNNRSMKWEKILTVSCSKKTKNFHYVSAMLRLNKNYNETISLDKSNEFLFKLPLNMISHPYLTAQELKSFLFFFLLFSRNFLVRCFNYFYFVTSTLFLYVVNVEMLVYKFFLTFEIQQIFSVVVLSQSSVT